MHLDQDRDFTAQTEVVLFGDRGSQNRSRAGIHRVAALLQNAITRLHLHAVPRPDHLVQTTHGREHRAILCC